jgi:hypothetical protein
MRRWAAVFVVAEGEDEDRLLQAYDEEVTIRRTLPRTSGSSGFQIAE